MISANVITVNEIISDVAIKIQEELSKVENNSFNIKLGSLTGSRILAGRGPNIEIKIELNIRKIKIMGKLVIDGNKVYTVDESCMRRKNLTLEQIRQQEAGPAANQEESKKRIRR